jgi:hypothetical protein
LKFCNKKIKSEGQLANTFFYCLFFKKSILHLWTFKTPILTALKNKDKIKEQCSSYLKKLKEENPDKLKEYRRTYYLNKEKLK